MWQRSTLRHQKHCILKAFIQLELTSSGNLFDFEIVIEDLQIEQAF